MDSFLAACEHRLYRMALLATGHREDALDIVQDAMYKLARHYGERPETEWPPLVHRILQTTIRDWYRRNGLRRRVMYLTGQGEGEDGMEAFAAAPSSDSPERRLDGEEMVERLDRALRRLPLRQQQVFLLRAWEGLSVAETAHAMDCTEGSVKTHYSRALQSLRRMLGDMGHE
ncbi:MAG TPA: RNA polymerase sigma factor [Gammaproteobacteria bacterium]|nr:RNA polymerase sigma factor [Gammaproteobacteria bacterium]